MQGNDQLLVLLLESHNIARLFYWISGHEGTNTIRRAGFCQAIWMFFSAFLLLYQ